MRTYLGPGTEEALALGVFADGGCRAVEVCGFGVGGEDVGEEEVAYTALGNISPVLREKYQDGPNLPSGQRRLLRWKG